MAVLTDFEKKRQEDTSEAVYVGKPEKSTAPKTSNVNRYGAGYLGQPALNGVNRTGAGYVGSPSVPAGKPSAATNKVPTMLGNYSIDTDFMAERQKAEAAGDYGKAKEMEYLRNQKIGMTNSPYKTTNLYNYDDPYLGQLERMRDDIINRDAFDYDYRDDKQYQAIKSLKQKEADKAYADGYAAMSTQFEGGVPVNMMNKLMQTKSDIVDRADNYIPQLRQMAYDMYMDEGNRMRQDYAMTLDASSQDYNRWLADRDMAISGMENAYNRAWNENTYKDEKEYRDKTFNRGVLESDRAFDRGVLENDRAYDQDERWRGTAYNQWETEFYADENARKENLEIQKQQMKKGYDAADNDTLINIANGYMAANPGMGYGYALSLAKAEMDKYGMRLGS